MPCPKLVTVAVQVAIFALSFYIVDTAFVGAQWCKRHKRGGAEYLRGACGLVDRAILDLRSFTGTGDFSTMHLTTLGDFPSRCCLRLDTDPSNTVIRLGNRRRPYYIGYNGDLVLCKRGIHNSICLLRFGRATSQVQYLARFCTFLGTASQDGLLTLTVRYRKISVFSDCVILPPVRPPSVAAHAVSVRNLRNPGCRFIVRPVPKVTSFPPLGSYSVRKSTMTVDPLGLSFPYSNYITSGMKGLLVISCFSRRLKRCTMFGPKALGELVRFRSSLHRYSIRRARVLKVRVAAT